MKIKHILCCKAHSERIWAVAWSPVGDLVATCSTDCRVRIWKLVDTPKDAPNTSSLCASKSQDCCKEHHLVLEASLDHFYKRTVRSVRFTFDARYLVCASFDGSCGIFAPEHAIQKESTTAPVDSAVALCSGPNPWTCVAVLEGHESEVKCAAMDVTGNYVATCGRDKTIWIHQRCRQKVKCDVDDLNQNCGIGMSSFDFYCAAILTGHSHDVKHVCWSPTALLLASSSYDNTIRIWALDKQRDEWRCIQCINIHSNTVWSISFNENGTCLAGACADGSVCSFSSKSAIEYCKAVAEYKSATTGLLSHGTLATGRCLDALKRQKALWKFQLQHPLQADDWQLEIMLEHVHSRPAYSIDYGVFLLSGGGDGKVAISRTEGDLHSPIEFDAHRGDVNGVAWKRKSGMYIFATVGDDEYIKVWELVVD